MLKTHHNALKMLSKAKGERFKILLENTPSMYKAIKLLFNYILKGRLNLKKHHVKKLKPHRKLIRKIANGQGSKQTIQKGGSIINSILGTVVPLLSMIL